jgi:hypothetical protein
MDKMKDGGPAFPGVTGSPGSVGTWLASHPGMTLRDWLAGQVVTGLLAGQWRSKPGVSAREDAEGFAANAYAIADAMLSARERSTP